MVIHSLVDRKSVYGIIEVERGDKMGKIKSPRPRAVMLAMLSSNYAALSEMGRKGATTRRRNRKKEKKEETRIELQRPIQDFLFETGRYPD
jgi:hypothetical protein